MAIKAIAPQMAQTVADRAIQVHGGMGVSDDTLVACLFTLNRYVRITDGPEEVHMSQLGKLKIAEYVAANALNRGGQGHEGAAIPWRAGHRQRADGSSRIRSRCDHPHGRACSICGSDLHIYHGHGFSEDIGFCVGIEAVGEVVEVGRAARA